MAIIAGGIKFSADKLADVKITKSLSGSGLPVGGVCTSELSFTLNNSDGVVFDDNGEVTIADALGTYPPYYISSRSGGKNAEKYVCYDAMMYAENKFRYDWKAETVPRDERNRKYISSSMFLTLAAEQMGVSGIGGGGDDIHILRKYLKDKTIKEGLSFLANAWGGCWYVNSSGSVQFAALGQYNALFDAKSKIHAPVSLGYVRSGISRVVMTNTTKNKDIDTGGGTSAASILRLSSPIADAALAAAVLSRANGFVYRAFTCADILADQNVEVGSKIVFDENDEGDYFAYSVTLSLTASGVYASVSAPEVAENEYKFRGAVQSEIDGCIALGRQYENMVYDDGGLSFDFSEED